MSETQHPFPVPPAPKKEPVSTTQLGRTRTDSYAWMKDENWQQVLRDPSVLRPDITEHLKAENAYAESVLAGMEPFRKELLQEMIGRIPPAEESVPVPDGPWAYYSRFEDGAQHPLRARRPRDGSGGECDLRRAVADQQVQGDA